MTWKTLLGEMPSGTSNANFDVGQWNYNPKTIVITQLIETKPVLISQLSDVFYTFKNGPSIIIPTIQKCGYFTVILLNIVMGKTPAHIHVYYIIYFYI